jgi:hypothetical protein
MLQSRPVMDVQCSDRGVRLAAQPGREAEAEQAFRDAIAAGDGRANYNLGVLLAAQPCREVDAGVIRVESPVPFRSLLEVDHLVRHAEQLRALA